MPATVVMYDGRILNREEWIRRLFVRADINQWWGRIPVEAPRLERSSQSICRAIGTNKGGQESHQAADRSHSWSLQRTAVRIKLNHLLAPTKALTRWASISRNWC